MEDYKNASLNVLERAKDLVSRMAIAEKANQLRHDALEVDRPGIPAHNWWNEILHGVEDRVPRGRFLRQSALPPLMPASFFMRIGEG